LNKGPTCKGEGTWGEEREVEEEGWGGEGERRGGKVVPPPLFWRK